MMAHRVKLKMSIQNSPYMITKIEGNETNVNRINKLKGTAMEKLIEYTLKTFYGNVEKPKEIKNVLESIILNLKNRFIVLREFFADDNLFEKGEVIDVNDLRNIKRISFRIKDIETSIENVDIEKTVSFLIENKVLERISDKMSNKRLNNWRTIDTGKEKKLVIYEVANREYSKLQRKDAIRLSEFIAELMKYLNVRKASIIINERKENLENKNSNRISRYVFQELRKIRDKFGLNIRIVALDEWLKNFWLRNKKKAIYEVCVWREENGKYKYGILEVSSPSGIPPILILRYLGDKKPNNVNVKII